VSFLYAATLLGSALGSLGTGLLLMQLWDTATIARFLVLVGLALALSLAAGSFHGRDRLASVGGIAVLALAAVGLGPMLYAGVYERLLFKERYHGDHFDQLIENRHGVIAVAADQHVFGGGIDRGVSRLDLDGDQNNMIGALAISAMHASPSRVLLLGLGTGVWAQVVANLPLVKDITVVDANPGYLELVAHFPEVASLARNPRVHVIVDDPRGWLARHPDEHFDVVVSNTAATWRAYASTLLSVEFMRLVRDHLEPGGLFYVNTADAPNAFRGAFDVFPYGLRFESFAAVSMRPVAFDLGRWRRALAGFRRDGVPLFDTTSVVGQRRITAFLAAPGDSKGWYGAPMLESRVAIVRRLTGATAITDDNMGTEWRAVYPTLFVP
jgi:spermidine synthase